MEPGTVVLVVVLAAGTAFGLRRMATEGRVSLHVPGHRFTSEELGHDMGTAATFVQFSSPYCQPCKATHELLAEVAAADAGIAHIDMQVADHLDMVNKLHIMRTPTTVLLDAHGHVRFRSEGVPRRDELAEALKSL